MKNLNDVDITKYFKKIGRRFTILAFTTIWLLVGIVYLGYSKVSEVTIAKEALRSKLSETEIGELRVLKEKKELSNIEMEIAELKETHFEKDTNIQLMNTLKEIENLMIKYSFNNTKHAVLPKRANKDIFEIPVTIELEGEYKNVVRYLEEMNATNLPIALKDLQIFILEEEFEESYKDTERVKASLGIFVYEDKDHVEQLKEKVEIGEKTSPFGYFVYKTPDDKREGIDKYQDYLEQFNLEIKKEKRTEENNSLNPKSPQDASTDDKETESVATTQPMEATPPEKIIENNTEKIVE